MDEYKFYYDESEHSRKINLRTITADNYYDNFIVAIVGWKSKYEGNFFEKYTSFEEKYKHRQSKGELKSQTIRQNQFKFGFASLNNDNVNLIEDFFNLFDENILVYYSVISKIEHLVNQIFDGYKNSPAYDMDAMRYSITKAIIVYQPEDVMNGIYENTEEFIDALRDFFITQIKKNKANKELKEMEIKQFKQILMILDDISVVKSIDWNYNPPFYGFKYFLKERSIDNYYLTIDREGDESKTAKAAQQMGLIRVKEIDSLNSIGVRAADMLAGIISKLLKSLHSVLSPNTKERQLEKHILSSDWFKLDEQQLSLYKKLHYILVDLNNSWYKSFGGTYSDNLVSLIALLNFMSHFETIESIEDISMQGEYFNAYACESLASHYQTISYKLPITPIEEKTKDYFKNQRGAKVYFDINKQPLLEIKEGSTVYDVLSVGVDKEMVPTITIDGAEVKCYRLPIELTDWATTLIALASRGENILPSKVMFTKEKENLYADIL